MALMIGDLVLTIFHSFQVFGSALQLLAVVVFQWESVCSATRLWWNIFRDLLHQHNSEGIPREHEGEVAAVPCVAVVPVATVLAESMEPDVTVVGTV